MRKLAVMTIVNIISIYAATLLLPSINVESPYYLVLAGLALSLVNVLLRPILVVISLPINIITMGLFTLVINTWMIMLVDRFVSGLLIPGFWAALGIAVLIMLINQVFKGISSEYR